MPVLKYKDPTSGTWLALLGAKFSSALQVLSTPTVAMTLTGTGVDADPFEISSNVLDAIYTTDTDIEITDMTKGVIMSSPNGTRYRVTINDAGALVSTAL